MAPDEMTESFDKRAKSWDEDPIRVALALAVAAGIESRVPLTADMCGLEYGCGTGLLSFALQEAIGQITLADSSPGMLAVLREKIEARRISNMLPRQLDLMSDPLPQERYNVIASLMTLHHIPDTDRILRIFHSLLTSPGYLCIADLDSEDGSFHGSGFSGHNGFDRDTLAQQAKHAGFHRVEFSSAFNIHRENPARDFPVFLMIAEKR